jgi:hypothetical protein
MTLIARLICVIAALSLVAFANEPSEPPLLPGNVTWSADPRTTRTVQSALQNRHYYGGQSTGTSVKQLETPLSDSRSITV